MTILDDDDPAGSVPVAVRPRRRPQVPLLWRERDAVQIGLDTDHAVVVRGIDDTMWRWLHGLDGLTTWQQQLRRLRSMRGAQADGVVLLGALHRAHALDDGPEPAMGPLPRAVRERLAPDVAAAALARPEPAAGAVTLARRREAVVEVRGANRLGAAVVACLAGAGVGRVRVARLAGDPVQLTWAGVGVMGPGAEQVGRPAVESLRSWVREADAEPRRAERAADLVIVCAAGPLADETGDPLTAADRTHLVVRAEGPRAVVGPLVVPGLTACLRCLAEHRTDADPAWPRLAAQAGHPRRQPPPAVDAVLAAAAGSLAALHALAVLERREGEPLPPSATGLLEMTLPEVWWAHRPRGRHPRCWCSAHRLGAA